MPRSHSSSSSSIIATTTTTTTTAGVLNVRDFGATGDGKTDDAAAVAAAFAALAANSSGTVYFPPGAYVLRSTVTVPHADQLGPSAVRGDGPASMLLWPTDADLLVFDGASPAAFLLLQDLTILSTEAAKSPQSAAVRFTAGATKSQFTQLTLMGQGPVAGVDTVAVGAGFVLGNVTDTVSMRDCVVWGHTGDAVRIGRGSEVRVAGGRFVAFDKTGDSVGIHVTGNNGGAL